MAVITIYFALSATSLGALIAASYEMFLIVKWLGAAYLVWLGIAAFRGRSSSLSVNPARRAHLLRVFANGVALLLANPKALLFFVALLPQFIDPAQRIMPRDSWRHERRAGVSGFAGLRRGCNSLQGGGRTINHSLLV